MSRFSYNKLVLKYFSSVFVSYLGVAGQLLTTGQCYKTRVREWRGRAGFLKNLKINHFAVQSKVVIKEFIAFTCWCFTINLNKNKYKHNMKSKIIIINIELCKVMLMMPLLFV